ncbi:hypothetical protein J6590_083339 [Homalodisca vitripennis]|nr:hypothetical protein J6590_083339 [Homalodisca vitripennis]
MAADSLSVEEKLKLACYYEVSKICKFVCENNTLLGELQIDKQAKQLIAELIWKKLKIYAEDLEAFAKHAKRSTINAEDVKLLVRRNPSMNCLQNEKGEEGNSIPRNGKGIKQNAKVPFVSPNNQRSGGRRGCVLCNCAAPPLQPTPLPAPIHQS